MGWDAALKALSDPTRRTIFMRLLYGGDLNAGDIARHVGMSAPALSHHLTALKAADLVDARRDGQTIVYSLNTSAMCRTSSDTCWIRFSGYAGKSMSKKLYLATSIVRFRGDHRL